jgi:hypothetical protein
MSVAAPGAVERCTFCGVDERQPAPPPPWPQEDPTNLAPPVRTSGNGAVIAVALAVVVVAVAVIVVVVTRKSDPAAPSRPMSAPVTPPVTAASASPVLATPSRLTLATLGTLSASTATPLDAPGMVGPFESFDVVANYDWVTGIGAAWKPDALLYRLEVRPIAKDGTVNLGNGASGYVVSYQFESAACGCQLYVDLKAAGDTPQISVRRMGASPTELAIQKPACTLRQAFASLAKRVPMVSPSYSAVLLNNQHTTWVVSYFVSMNPARGGEAVIDVKTCGVESVR